jgi:hypothetical protein
MLVPACACGFVLLIGILRIRHLDYLVNAAGTPVALKAGSPTGYAEGVRRFIPGVRDAVSFEPIAQTQQMLARGEWRVRHVDYDDPPLGRAVLSASPYRWWLGALAMIDHALTARPAGAAVERAALFADPLLQLLLLAATAIFVARRFGAFPAALLSVGFVVLLPFAGAFAPGRPRGDGLAAIVALWSLLPLLPVARDRGASLVRRDFFVAGLIGGLGLWLDVGGELPFLIGIAAGGLAAAWLARRNAPSSEALPWRTWAAGGALACLAAYVLEFLPGHAPGWRLDVIHPLHGLAWLGLGELLARADRRTRGGPFATGWRQFALVAVSAIAIAVPLALAWHNRRSLFGLDPSLLRLTPLVDGAVAGNLWAWISRDGFSPLALATLLPLFLIAPLAWLVLRRPVEPRAGIGAALVLGAIVATLALACVHLRRWVQLDAALLAGLVVATATALRARRPRLTASLWSAGLALAVLPGLSVLTPSFGSIQSVSEPELESLIETDLAHWLARRTGAGRAAVLASPNLAASLAFEGGLHALGSPYPENRTGLDLSIRIAATTSQDEAYALVQRHQITHVVLASWDPSLEQLAHLGSEKDRQTLVGLLHRWLPPRWLRPVPYPLPQVQGFEGQSVLVFEVVELQDNALALSRLAEYFVETGRTDLAGRAAFALGRSFPDDLGAQAARVQAASAAGDQDEARAAFKSLEARLAADASPSLPWDRRISVAIVLAEAKRFDQARALLEQSLAEIDEPRLRSLTPLSLYRFEALTKALGLRITDPHLAELARALLPPEMGRDS